MALHSGERQVAPVLEEIRADHTARYRWAAAQLPPGSRVLDLCCGVGYGAAILADAGHKVWALDIDREAIDYAREHYSRPGATFIHSDVADLYYQTGAAGFDACVCFEAIEHLADPLPMLRLARRTAPLLLASVPNESKFPFRGYAFHHRHYTGAQFALLMHQAGFVPLSAWGQEGPESEVERDVDGRTMIYIAERTKAKVTELHAPKADALALRDAPKPQMATPEHVVILGLGPSLEAYVDRVKRMGSRKAFADEVWGINAVGDVVQCDRVFHMDDVRIQEIRACARPESNIAHMIAWMRAHPGPIYTSRAYQEYPGLVEYPLADVINSAGFAYFAGTAAYAIAFALHLGVKRLSIFGADYSYRDSAFAEKGRANLEFWLGLAFARGVEICVPEQSSLLDAYEPEETRFYGYGKFGTRDVVMTTTGGVASVELRERAALPTADEIERAYDHDTRRK